MCGNHFCKIWWFSGHYCKFLRSSKSSILEDLPCLGSIRILYYVQHISVPWNVSILSNFIINLRGCVWLYDNCHFICFPCFVSFHVFNKCENLLIKRRFFSLSNWQVSICSLETDKKQKKAIKKKSILEYRHWRNFLRFNLLFPCASACGIGAYPYWSTTRWIWRYAAGSDFGAEPDKRSHGFCLG